MGEAGDGKGDEARGREMFATVRDMERIDL